MPAKPKPSATSSTDTNEPSVRVLRRFRQVFTAVRSHFQLVEKRTGVGGAQLWALGVIGDRPGIGVTELARAMQIHQSTTSNLIRGLVERGLVRAAREGTDRRAVQLHLLPMAQQVLERAPGPYAGLLPQALERLDPATLARLEADLTQLVEALGVGVDAPAIPLAQL